MVAVLSDNFVRIKHIASILNNLLEGKVVIFWMLILSPIVIDEVKTPTKWTATKHEILKLGIVQVLKVQSHLLEFHVLVECEELVVLLNLRYDYQGCLLWNLYVLEVK